MAGVKSMTENSGAEWVCLLEQIQTTSSASSEKIAWSRNIFVLLGMRQFGQLIRLPQSIGHLSSGPSNCITNASNHCRGWGQLAA